MNINEIIKKSEEEFSQGQEKLILDFLAFFTREQYGKRYFAIGEPEKLDLLRYEGPLKELEKMVNLNIGFLSQSIRQAVEEAVKSVVPEHDPRCYQSNKDGLIGAGYNECRNEIEQRITNLLQ